MKIAVVGTGYVGLVTGTCFAESGNHVTCIDIDKEKVARLNRGEIPIYEPGLAELVEQNREAERIEFTTDLAAGVRNAKLVFLAVGTPPAADGSADLTALWRVVDDLAAHLPADAIVVTKSTVPVGTNAGIFRRLKESTGRECDVASNPEFLKEGAAIEDFMKPDRVVVGVRRAETADVLRELYSPFLRTEKPFLSMSPESAEMTKYVANALLSTKISFINEVANLCERMKADINDVRRGIGHDSRIGFAFLFPGVGYGGSCFPKDVRALASLARGVGIEPQILDAVDAVNTRQKSVMPDKIEQFFDGKLSGKTVAIWGLAFKPRTDDIREAPALALIDRLLAGWRQGAGPRSRGAGKRPCPVRQEDRLLRAALRGPGRRRRAGHHDRVEAIPAARLRRDAQPDACPRDLRRPQSLQPHANEVLGFQVPIHRPRCRRVTAPVAYPILLLPRVPCSRSREHAVLNPAGHEPSRQDPDLGGPQATRPSHGASLWLGGSQKSCVAQVVRRVRVRKRSRHLRPRGRRPTPMVPRLDRPTRTVEPRRTRSSQPSRFGGNREANARIATAMPAVSSRQRTVDWPALNRVRGVH